MDVESKKQLIIKKALKSLRYGKTLKISPENQAHLLAQCRALSGATFRSAGLCTFCVVTPDSANKYNSVLGKFPRGLQLLPCSIFSMCRIRINL